MTTANGARRYLSVVPALAGRKSIPQGSQALQLAGQYAAPTADSLDRGPAASATVRSTACLERICSSRLSPYCLGLKAPRSPAKCPFRGYILQESRNHRGRNNSHIQRLTDRPPT